VKANFGLFSFAIFSQNIFGFVGLALWLAFFGFGYFALGLVTL
jgi:hypothetical protein